MQQSEYGERARVRETFIRWRRAEEAKERQEKRFAKIAAAGACVGILAVVILISRMGGF